MPDQLQVETVSHVAENLLSLEAEAAVVNPHALPAAIAAAGKQAAKTRVVMARTSHGEVVGCWPFAEQRVPPGLRVLKTPLIPLYDLSGSPLIRATDASGVVMAILEHLRSSENALRVLMLRNLQAEGPVWAALQAAAAAGSISFDILERWERALLDKAVCSDAEGYLSGALSSSSRKRLRSKRKALEQHGALVLTVHSVSETIDEPFERFMDLEASGWKGRDGTALVQKPADAAYVRSVIKDMAALDRAFVAEMRIGDRAIASGLFLRCASEVFFWKTAYDDSLAKQSPGVIFDMMLTEWLYRQEWFERLDTGSDNSVDPETLIWKQRRPMANVVLSLDPGSLSGRLVVAGLKLRAMLKRLKARS
jgi:CelD/BcsL family acetyltransferase involved in cellulose biosynthesis